MHMYNIYQRKNNKTIPYLSITSTERFVIFSQKDSSSININNNNVYHTKSEN